MCLFPKPETPEAPELPPETQAMKQPNAEIVRSSVGQDTANDARGVSTILTSGSGVTETAPTEKKTLLGQ
jgi:hypothetical protein